MNLNEAKELMLRRSNAFHERYFTAYGQLMVRLDRKTYAKSRPNLRLSKLTADDIGTYNIHTGDIGKLFRSHRDVNAIVFVCTEAATRFSMNEGPMRPMLDDLAQIIGPDVPVCASAKEANKALKTRRGGFLHGSGILAVGSTLEEAIAGARIIEKGAEAEMFADKVHGLEYLSPAQAADLHRFYDRTYSIVNKTGQADFINSGPEEFRLRSKIIEASKKMSWEDLVQGSWGNISVRLNDDMMLITPTGMDYFDIRMEDIVRVNIHTLEYGPQRKPSSECRLHAALYRKYPECNAVIHTHSNGISVFSAGHAGFRITDEVLKPVIGDLRCSQYQTPGTDELCESVLEALEGSHACIVANHGAVFYSSSLELALSIADAVESRACNLLDFGTTIHSREFAVDTNATREEQEGGLS